MFAVCQFPGAAAEFAELADLIDSGQVRVPPTQVFPMEEIGKVQELVKTQHTQGKLAIKIADI